MQNWTSLSRGDLLMELFLAEQNLSNDSNIFWNRIKINPIVWKCTDVIEDNFWVVAKHKYYIIWYNDIEEGFSISKFNTEGFFLEYSAVKNELEQALQKLLKKDLIIRISHIKKT